MEKGTLMSTDFDPDEFVLVKQDVIDFLDIVLQYWKRDTRSLIRNIKLIGGLEAMKTGVKLGMGDDEFKIIWSMLLTFIAQLQYQNAIAKATRDGETWGMTVSKLKQDLRDGGLEKLMQRYLK